MTGEVKLSFVIYFWIGKNTSPCFAFSFCSGISECGVFIFCPLYNSSIVLYNEKIMQEFMRIQSYNSSIIQAAGSGNTKAYGIVTLYYMEDKMM